MRRQPGRVHLAWTLCLLTYATTLQAADPPSYPHLDLATWYEVDAKWPQKPAGVEWGAMSGMAVDDRDQVYVFTRGPQPVQVYSADGKFLRAWGDKDIKTSHHLKLDGQGNVWVADIGRHVIMQFTPQGELLRTLGTPDMPGEDETHLNQPTDMAITPEGEVFVSDGYGNNRVVHFDRHGKFVKSWGRLGVKPGEFSIPHAITLDSKGRLYVADRNNVRVQVFDQDGKLLDVWSNIVCPWGFCVTPRDEIWICGSSPTAWKFSGPDMPVSCPPRDQVFMKFNPSGKLLQLWTVPKGTDGAEQPGDLNWVHCLALDSKGNIYAGDIIGKRAQRFVRHAPDVK